MTKSRGIIKRVQYTPEQIEAIRTRYPHERTNNIARDLGLTVNNVYQRAAALGLCKTPEYLASPDACRLKRDSSCGELYRYTKGHIPANKGTRRPGWSAGRMVDTQFKKGQKPHSWRPIGTERLSKEGYLQVKLRETGVSRHDYVAVHQLVWELHRGAIPAKHHVAFKDGDKTNITIENLELVSFADMMKRNTLHNYPKEIASVIQLRGTVQRQINRRQRNGKAEE